MAKERSYTDDQLRQAIREAVSWTQVSTLLGAKKGSGSVVTSARKRAELLGIDVSHLTLQAAKVCDKHATLVPTRKGTTTDVGHIANAFASAILAVKGFVAIPALEGSRYDLLLEQPQGRFERLQCKNGRIRGKVLQFNTRSRSGGLYKAGYVSKAYTKDDIDYFAVFCSDNGTLYLIPVEDVQSSVMSLRLEAPENGQAFNIKWAATYEIGKLSDVFKGM